MSTAATTSDPQLPSDAQAHHAGRLALSLGALGVVYGDIGTSPLYAIKECFLGMSGEKPVDFAHAMGVLSLATWALVLVVVVKYLTFALRADNRGEGGILAMMSLLMPHSTQEQADGGKTRPNARRYVLVLGLIAMALLLADGMITPAISVVGAMEGLKAAPGLVAPLAAVIIVALFCIQKHGTHKIGRLFGPAMLLWFSTIAVVGVPWIIKEPRVLAALSPHYAVSLFWYEPGQAFHLLASVVLVITGAEALYADMGHFGRGPIRLAWYTVVMPALLLNYYGQVACVLNDPKAVSEPFWAVVPERFRYVMLGIATMAAVIASQAMISGAYSLARQAVQLGYCPRLKIVHTSAAMIGQVYVPFVNWMLMVPCVALVLTFQTSTALAAMYGLAVMGTMTITSVLLLRVARERWGWKLGQILALFSILFVVDLAFLFSNVPKVPHGGWVTILIAGAVFIVSWVWIIGRTMLAKPIFSVSLPLPLFLRDIEREKPHRVPGTAVFMASRGGVVPMALMHHIKHNRVLHDRVILLSVQTLPVPKVADEQRLEVREVGQGFWEVGVTYGFIEEPDVPAALIKCRSHGLKVDPQQVSYYLGRVSLRVVRRKPMGRWAKGLFTFMYHNERAATEYFHLPANRVVELGRQLEM